MVDEPGVQGKSGLWQISSEGISSSAGFADDPTAQPPGLAQQRGSQILRTLKVSYFPADNPTLAAGHYAGQLQLVTINAADTEHNPVRLDIKIDK